MLALRENPIAEKVVVHGISMGSCVASGALSLLARDNPSALRKITHLILEAPFTRASEVGLRKSGYLLSLWYFSLPLVENTLDLVEGVASDPDFQAKIRIIQKENDDVIYPDMAKRVAEVVDAIVEKRRANWPFQRCEARETINGETVVVTPWYPHSNHTSPAGLCKGAFQTTLLLDREASHAASLATVTKVNRTEFKALRDFLLSY